MKVIFFVLLLLPTFLFSQTFTSKETIHHYANGEYIVYVEVTEFSILNKTVYINNHKLGNIENVLFEKNKMYFNISDEMWIVTFNKHNEISNIVIDQGTLSTAEIIYTNDNYNDFVILNTKQI